MINKNQSALRHPSKCAMRTGFVTAIIPGVMCVGGVYFFHIGVITAGVLYNLSLGAGVGNAMLPKLRSKSISKS
ncbi:MAG: hypothetical protein DRR19_07990 [Candidatus Parabeggiatoa sp. nov. 1]|nr:MAG: hypothetical protein DRR19_07990 [Gammaproteobacteria bacterium]